MIDFLSILKGFAVLKASVAAKSANTHYIDSRQAAEPDISATGTFQGLVLCMYELFSVCSVKAGL